MFKKKKNPPCPTKISPVFRLQSSSPFFALFMSKNRVFPCARIIYIRSLPSFQKKMRLGRKKTRKSFAGSGKGSNFALAFGNEGHRRPPGAQKNSSLTDWKTSNKAAVLDERKQDRQAYTSIRHPSRNHSGGSGVANIKVRQGKNRMDSIKGGASRAIRQNQTRRTNRSSNGSASSKK